MHLSLREVFIASSMRVFIVATKSIINYVLQICCTHLLRHLNSSLSCFGVFCRRKHCKHHNKHHNHQHHYLNPCRERIASPRLLVFINPPNAHRAEGTNIWFSSQWMEALMSNAGVTVKRKGVGEGCKSCCSLSISIHPLSTFSASYLHYLQRPFFPRSPLPNRSQLCFNKSVYIYQHTFCNVNVARGAKERVRRGDLLVSWIIKLRFSKPNLLEHFGVSAAFSVRRSLLIVSAFYKKLAAM